MRSGNKYRRLISGAQPWRQTEAALRSQIVAWGGAPVEPAGNDVPTITVGAANTSAITGTLTAPSNAIFSNPWGAGWAAAGAVFPDNTYRRFFNLTFSTTARGNGPAARVPFVLTGTRCEVYVKGRGAANSSFAVWVNGARYATVAGTSIPADGSGYYVLIEFSTSATREIEIEANLELFFGGVKIESGTTIAATSRSSGLKFVLAGDSFMEGTGATRAITGLAPTVTRNLGARWTSVSPFGGTGWVQDLSASSRLALKDRYAADILAPVPDVILVALGINDETLVGSGTDLSPVVTTFIDAARAVNPACLIYLVGPWNPGAPSLTGNRLTVRNMIRGAAGSRRGVTFLDPSEVSYTKFDATHPDQAGHETLAAWLSSAIRQSLGVPT